MATALRKQGKPSQVFYAVLGIPCNMRSKRTKEQRKLDRRLNAEETVRVR